MLVLSRKRNEKIVIGHNIVLTVLTINSTGTVRLGIEAPRDIPVHRQEIAPARRTDNAKSGEAGAGPDPQIERGG